MGINISPKNDYSMLFSSLPNNSSSNSIIGGGSLDSLLTSGALSDYASIKNGSYGKLMKAYYAKDGNSDEVSSVINKQNNEKSSINTQELTDVKGAASSFKKSLEDMKDDFSDKDAAYNAVSGFVKNYNSLIEKSDSLGSNAISNRTDTLKKLTTDNKELLSSVGITVDEKNKLSVDEEKFKASSLDDVKKIFGEKTAYGYQAMAQAELIDSQAGYEALKLNTYTAQGSINSSASLGTLLNGLV